MMKTDNRKIALVGTGMVGMSFAYSLLNQSVCDELVRLHNGSLNLYSEPEIGTTVEILLPLAARNRKGNEYVG